MTMKVFLAVTIAAALAGTGEAQLLTPNAAGVTMGHMHLNVKDVAVQKTFWTVLFSATPLKKEGLEGVKVPGMIILFTVKEPTGPSEGAAIDHFGFKVHNTEEKLKQARDMGYTTRPVFKGAEGNPNAYIDGPDGLKVEVQEDSTLTGPPTPNHVHYMVKDNSALRDWYVKTFGAVARNRGILPVTADISTMNLTFSSFKEDTPRAATKGRAIDHVGLEVKDLEAFCKQLEASGVKFDVPYRKIPKLGIAIAFLTDPVGGYIELTEGLNAF
jgi:catechol 2,3-dioxygenase-like lactoylglutathione lyase family enzyme